MATWTTQNVLKLNKTQHKKTLKDEQHRPPSQKKNNRKTKTQPGVNPGAHEGLAVPVSYHMMIWTEKKCNKKRSLERFFQVKPQCGLHVKLSNIYSIVPEMSQLVGSH